MATEITKEYILGEISRLAEANDGKPVGRSRFLSDTGIKPYHWGRFWATWGDALREAGFQANALRSSSLDRGYLLKRLALLTREQKHFPTKAEMRLVKIKDPSFPNYKTFSIFGQSDQQVQALSEYCAAQADFLDVVEILAAIPPKPQRSEIGKQGTTNGNSGYVYLIRAKDVYKIGCTEAPYRRAAEIANQSAYGAELIHLIPTDDPLGIERYWHSRFDAKKVAGINKKSGEWFKLSAEDVSAFKRRKNFM